MVNLDTHMAMSVECGFVNTLPPRMLLFWMTYCSDTSCFLPLLRGLRQVPETTKTFAAHLVDQSMLRRVGDAFRVHDLVLHFLKLKLKADPSRPTATGRP